MDTKLFSLIAFSTTDLIDFKRMSDISEKFTDLSEFLDCDFETQAQILKLKSETCKDKLINMKNAANRVIEKCHQEKIALISLDDPRYPSQLKNIDDPPYLLYTKGNLDPNIPLISVIGTRKSTYESEEVNRWFCKSFVQYGIGIASGLARGHDAVASFTALENEGYSIGVLGTAIDVIYPANYKNLYKKMIDHGAIISEYPPGLASGKWRFPRRNRIVSGIAQAILVVQAPLKSGTMITVNMALSQGRDVYAVPGNPMNSQNEGTNLLIQNGSKIAISPEEIIHDILKSHPNTETIQFLSIHKNKKNETSKSALIELSPNENTILSTLNSDTHIDEILNQTEFNISTLNAILTMMEIKGLILKKPGQIYSRISE